MLYFDIGAGLKVAREVVTVIVFNRLGHFNNPKNNRWMLPKVLLSAIRYP